jgi:hypothetical protein
MCIPIRRFIHTRYCLLKKYFSACEGDDERDIEDTGKNVDIVTETAFVTLAQPVKSKQQTSVETTDTGNFEIL